MVILKLEELELTYEEKNIADPGVLQELLEKGSEKQTPCLVDDNMMMVIYESSDIVAHLEKNYS